jgi:hypothetical protein
MTNIKYKNTFGVRKVSATGREGGRVPMFFKFDSKTVKSTVCCSAGHVTIVEEMSLSKSGGSAPGDMFPSVVAWITDKNRLTSGAGHHQVSYRPSEEASWSSIAWVPDKEQYMEVYADDVILFRHHKRRWWSSVGAWIAACAGELPTVDVSAGGPNMKQCGHPCLLGATSACCACGDKRPVKSVYTRYVDGVGIVSDNKRWDDYCGQCAAQ